jgi:Spy/CpxP family protein refolding chaperone
MKSTVLLVCLASASLLAQGPGPRARLGPAAGEAPALTELTQFLNLSDAQLTQLKQLRADHAALLQPNATKARELGQQLAEAMRSDNPDSARVGQLLVDIKKLREAGRDSHEALAEKSRAVLTPEQRAKLQTLEEARKLGPAARQATALGLLALPEPGSGQGMLGRPGGRGAMPMRGPGGRGQMMGRGPGAIR